MDEAAAAIAKGDVAKPTPGVKMDLSKVDCNDAASLLAHLGSIDDIEVIGYYKWEFSLRARTSSGAVVRFCVGDEPSDIYRYEPWSKDWDEHVGAGISDLSLLWVEDPVAQQKEKDLVNYLFND